MKKTFLRTCSIFLILLSVPIADCILYWISNYRIYASEYPVILAGVILSIIVSGILLFIASFLEK